MSTEWGRRRTRSALHAGFLALLAVCAVAAGCTLSDRYLPVGSIHYPPNETGRPLAVLMGPCPARVELIGSVIVDSSQPRQTASSAVIARMQRRARHVGGDGLCNVQYRMSGRALDLIAGGTAMVFRGELDPRTIAQLAQDPSGGAPTSAQRMAVAPTAVATPVAVVAPSGDAQLDTLRLRNGTVLRGHVAEVIPNVSVTLMLVTNHPRTVAWSTIASVNGPGFAGVNVP